MSTQHLRPETRAALLAAMLRLEALLLGRNAPGVADLVERAEADIAAGWPEAALDCLGRAQRLISTSEASQ